MLRGGVGAAGPRAIRLNTTTRTTPISVVVMIVCVCCYYYCCKTTFIIVVVVVVAAMIIRISLYFVVLVAITNTVLPVFLTHYCYRYE